MHTAVSKMYSLEQQYVNLLRKSATEPPPPGLRSPQAHGAANSRDIESKPNALEYVLVFKMTFSSLMTSRQGTLRSRPVEVHCRVHKRRRSQDSQATDGSGSSYKKNNSSAVATSGSQVRARSSGSSRFHFHSGENGRHLMRDLFNPVATKSPSSTAGQYGSSSSHHSGELEPETVRTQHEQSAQTHHMHNRSSTPIEMPFSPLCPDMVLQPESQPISQEQLATEVKSIFAGLTMVESKCIHVDRAQALAFRNGWVTMIKDEQWQALIALHVTLLHEHHDFFVASQHPSASHALRRLAIKWSMPARMWKHGIHALLEILRHRLPDSLEFMICFIYKAYQLLSLLYETVPVFKSTWIECLGDLGRYRMAIEDEDVRSRERWAHVSRAWYTKAADECPHVGRLYHHLAILARPDALQQLSLYSRSLMSVQIFRSARESILTLFGSGLSKKGASTCDIDTHFIKTHAVLFKKVDLDQYEKNRDCFINLLGTDLGQITAKWRMKGAFIMLINLGALFDYGSDTGLRRIYERGFHKLAHQAPASPSQDMSESTVHRSEKISQGCTSPPGTDEECQTAFRLSLNLTFLTTKLVLERTEVQNALPFVHILLSFLCSIVSMQALDTQFKTLDVCRSIIQSIPRKELCSFLNRLPCSECSLL